MPLIKNTPVFQHRTFLACTECDSWICLSYVIPSEPIINDSSFCIYTVTKKLFLELSKAFIPIDRNWLTVLKKQSKSLWPHCQFKFKSKFNTILNSTYLIRYMHVTIHSPLNYLCANLFIIIKTVSLRYRKNKPSWSHYTTITIYLILIYFTLWRTCIISCNM